MDMQLAIFVKDMRKEHGLTQEDLAAKAGVGLRFVRELEQGKQTLRMDKINQVLALFGHEVGAKEMKGSSGSDHFLSVAARHFPRPFRRAHQCARFRDRPAARPLHSRTPRSGDRRLSASICLEST